MRLNDTHLAIGVGLLLAICLISISANAHDVKGLKIPEKRPDENLIMWQVFYTGYSSNGEICGMTETEPNPCEKVRVGVHFYYDHWFPGYDRVDSKRTDYIGPIPID